MWDAAPFPSGFSNTVPHRASAFGRTLSCSIVMLDVSKLRVCPNVSSTLSDFAMTHAWLTLTSRQHLLNSSRIPWSSEEYQPPLSPPAARV
eukprot:m.205776 g.205776  ORF g.205776 m.205776 type:complete len:91 (+) comp15418_c0_seq3:5023-5295(+)